MKLPKRISTHRVEILKVLAASQSSLTCRQIADALSPPFNDRVDQAVYQLYQAGYLGRDAKETNGIKYYLSKLGKYTLSNLDKIQKFDAKPHGKRPKKAPSAVSKPAPIEAPTFNISSTAEQLSNNIAAVLHENEQYRDLLLKLHSTIGHALGLNKSTEKSE